MLTNTLHRSASTYLQQHASNPVAWQAWSDQAWQYAVQHDKLVLLSIGYASCHWCHVMEHESFADASIATLMNDHFVCIKVDREEHPDVDQFYMDAVQMMSGRGGWPLNVFCVADGRPIYGGTYFRPAQWKQLLEQLSTLYTTEPERVLSAAGDSMDVLQQRFSSRTPNNTHYLFQDLLESVSTWSRNFDLDYGGDRGAPKFPMPAALSFVQDLSSALKLYSSDETQLDLARQLEAHVERSVDGMCRGGLYDQLGGGFSRYSTDERWIVPHFEKMLYDNAQLISLVAKRHTLRPSEESEQVLRASIAFLERELRSPTGCYYSALDADSEGEEGRYYTWTQTELRELLGSDYDLAAHAFGFGAYVAEDGRYVLVRHNDNEACARAVGMEPEDLNSALSRIRHTLFEHRRLRPSPIVDRKLLVSWNALAVSALVNAAGALHDSAYASRADEILRCLLTESNQGTASLSHILAVDDYRDHESFDAFADDYVFLAQACLDVYEMNGREDLLHKSIDLCDELLQRFADPSSAYVLYSSRRSTLALQSRPETHDTVIPSSNAKLATLLTQLGVLCARPDYLERAAAMIQATLTTALRNPQYHSAWLGAALQWCLSPLSLRSSTEIHAKARTAITRHNHPYVIWIQDAESVLDPDHIECCDQRSCELFSLQHHNIDYYVKRKRGVLAMHRSLIAEH